MSSITIHPGRQYRRRYFVAKFKLGRKVGLLALCFLTIAIISAIDIWFAVTNSQIIHVEKNPVCMALIAMDPRGFSFFMLGKASGTAMVLFMLTLLHRCQYRHANTVTFAIAVFQIGLLTFLTLSDPLTCNLPNFGLLFGETPESIWLISDH